MKRSEIQDKKVIEGGGNMRNPKRSASQEWKPRKKHRAFHSWLAVP